MTCGLCNREIPTDRLSAVPKTKLCVKCQAKVDVPLRPEDIPDAMGGPGEITIAEMLGR